MAAVRDSLLMKSSIAIPKSSKQWSLKSTSRLNPTLPKTDQALAHRSLHSFQSAFLFIPSLVIENVELLESDYLFDAQVFEAALLRVPNEHGRDAVNAHLLQTVQIQFAKL